MNTGNSYISSDEPCRRGRFAPDHSCCVHVGDGCLLLHCLLAHVMRRRSTVSAPSACNPTLDQFFVLQERSEKPDNVVYIRLRENQHVEALIGSTAYAGRLDDGAVIQGLDLQPPPPQIIVALFATPDATAGLDLEHSRECLDADALLRCCAPSQGLSLSLFVPVRKIDAIPLFGDALSGLFAAVTAWRAIAIGLAEEEDSSGTDDDDSPDKYASDIVPCSQTEKERYDATRARAEALDNLFLQFKNLYEDDLARDIRELGFVAFAQASVSLKERSKIVIKRKKQEEAEKLRLVTAEQAANRTHYLDSASQVGLLQFGPSPSKRRHVTVFEDSDSDGIAGSRHRDEKKDLVDDRARTQQEGSETHTGRTTVAGSSENLSASPASKREQLEQNALQAPPETKDRLEAGDAGAAEPVAARRTKCGRSSSKSGNRGLAGHDRTDQYSQQTSQSSYARTASQAPRGRRKPSAKRKRNLV